MGYLKATIVLLCITGGFEQAKTRNEMLRQKLVGDWYVESNSKRTLLTAGEDGKFVSRTLSGDKELWSCSGDWQVNNGRLEGTYRRASVASVPIGKLDVSTILEVTDSYYVITNRNGARVIYHRLKTAQ